MSSIKEIMQFCRLCLVKDQVNVAIFEEHGDTRDVKRKISACLPVTVSEEDRLPKKICDGCLYKLDLLYQFRTTCVSAEKQLQVWLDELNNSESISKDDEVLQLQHTQTSVKEEIIDSMDHQEKTEYVVEQQQISYEEGDIPYNESQDEIDDGDATNSSDDEPLAKRRKRILEEQQRLQIAETSKSTEGNNMAVTKLEHESDDENVDDPEPNFVSVSNDDQQPGPSGLNRMSTTTNNAEIPIVIFPKQHSSFINTTSPYKFFYGARYNNAVVDDIPPLIPLERKSNLLQNQDFPLIASFKKRIESIEKITDIPPLISLTTKSPSKLTPENIMENHTKETFNISSIKISNPRTLSKNKSLCITPTKKSDNDENKLIFYNEPPPLVEITKKDSISQEISKKIGYFEEVYIKEESAEEIVKDNSTQETKTNIDTNKCLKSDKRCICEICGHISPSYYYHKIHYCVSHLGERIRITHKCEKCQKGFINFRSYYLHRYNVHTTKNKTTQQQFLCEFCNIRFSCSRYKFILHQNNHGRVKCLLCVHCGKRFSSSIAFKSHIDMHHHDYRYICKTCTKGFFTYYKWKNHLNFCK